MHPEIVPGESEAFFISCARATKPKAVKVESRQLELFAQWIE
jgi:hypothetical protein